MAFTYCWRSGEIDVGQTVPRGALVLAEGNEEQLSEAVLAAYRSINARIVTDGASPLEIGERVTIRFEDWFGGAHALVGTVESDSPDGVRVRIREGFAVVVPHAPAEVAP